MSSRLSILSIGAVCNFCRTLCGVILFLCFVGTMLDVISNCMKPTKSSLSKNDGFMPVKHGHVEYDSSLVDTPESSGTYRYSSSIPLLVYDKQEGMQSLRARLLLYAGFQIYSSMESGAIIIIAI